MHYDDLRQQLDEAWNDEWFGGLAAEREVKRLHLTA